MIPKKNNSLREEFVLCLGLAAIVIFAVVVLEGGQAELIFNELGVGSEVYEGSTTLEISPDASLLIRIVDAEGTEVFSISADGVVNGAEFDAKTGKIRLKKAALDSMPKIIESMWGGSRYDPGDCRKAEGK